jgi:hypothetical protein
MSPIPRHSVRAVVQKAKLGLAWLKAEKAERSEERGAAITHYAAESFGAGQQVDVGRLAASTTVVPGRPSFSISSKGS